MNSNKVEERLFNPEISSFLHERNVGLFGYADLSPIPQDERYRLPRSISFGFPLEQRIIKGIMTGPTYEYYLEYERLNALLVKTAKDLQMFISSFGFKALALEGLIRKMNDKNLSTKLPHKTSATLSGLGWIGKCNLLVTNEFGSAVRLSTVLTDMPLEVGEPTIQSKCGDCTICQLVCPGKAITGKNWIQGMKREEIYDVYACKAKATELSTRIGAKHTICGICIANCPWTLKYVNG